MARAMKEGLEGLVLKDVNVMWQLYSLYHWKDCNFFFFHDKKGFITAVQRLRQISAASTKVPRKLARHVKLQNTLVVTMRSVQNYTPRQTTCRVKLRFASNCAMLNVSHAALKFRARNRKNRYISVRLANLRAVRYNQKYHFNFAKIYRRNVLYIL